MAYYRPIFWTLFLLYLFAVLAAGGYFVYRAVAAPSPKCEEPTVVTYPNAGTSSTSCSA